MEFKVTDSYCGVDEDFDDLEKAIECGEELINEALDDGELSTEFPHSVEVWVKIGGGSCTTKKREDVTLDDENIDKDENDWGNCDFMCFDSCIKLNTLGEYLKRTEE